MHEELLLIRVTSYRTSAKITPAYRPTQSDNLTTGKMVDYAIYLEPYGPARDIVLSLTGMSTDSINHVGYEGLYARPVAVSIETKTESRSVEEAKVQLGVWVAAQVARIEALLGQLAQLEMKKPPAAEARLGRLELDMVTRGRRKTRGRGGRTLRAEQPQTQEPTSSPTIVMVRVPVISSPRLYFHSSTSSLNRGRSFSPGSRPQTLPTHRIRTSANRCRTFRSFIRFPWATRRIRCRHIAWSGA